MAYKELIEQLKYYGHTYTIGENLGREIQGTDELLMAASDAICELEIKLTQVKTERDLAVTLIEKNCQVCKRRPLCFDQTTKGFNMFHECVSKGRNRFEWNGRGKNDICLHNAR